jgi:hypothetical protein
MLLQLKSDKTARCRLYKYIIQLVTSDENQPINAESKNPPGTHRNPQKIERRSVKVRDNLIVQIWRAAKKLRL